MFGNSWKEFVEGEKKEAYFKNLMGFLDEEYQKYEVFPSRDNIFRSLELTPFDQVKVVILGQDPYYRKGQADGLAFSVPSHTKIPPSLKNIFKEVYDDIGSQVKSTDLSPWSKEGVLLLNTVLTVREGKPNSHRNRGWEIFTNKVIYNLAKSSSPKVFILWGSQAIEKEVLIREGISARKEKGVLPLILKGVHPSPLSAYRGFFGGKYFSKTNKYLEENGCKPIKW